MIEVWLVWIGALCIAIGVLGAVGAWADLDRWLKHRHYPYAPLWVNWAYRVMEWVDYKVVSPVSRRLMYWRGDLLDRYCKCPKCKERDRRVEEFRKALTGSKRD